MTRQFWMAAVAALCLTTPVLGETAPTAVAYVDGAIEASLTGGPGDVAAGKKVMTTASLGNCVACHQIGTIPEADFQGDIAPPLDGVADRYSEAQLRGLVANAKMTFEGSFMPAFYKTEGFIRPGAAYSGKAPTEALPPILTAQQVEDVVAYLMTMTE
ncbi:sulfur oxidation c-type cytochrome SoxX [Pseudotabrizicola sediminis]|uniref:Sulfur oxidation c-type cytochrome SoxX n=1 Tax=Pseudotabrizicola sediminis TaxID=2486418 RepID=A0ABY2KKA8_9RHOB|nr:sulfur oxidation c-type cytochrome SoxX [Pseudotabrizicola sediminis]TGD42447.1 sulfur oxidation c-type cytochrome SoxX [Pseudotabrizicola sediminis]TGD65179.1 sulfur oxidation c-type cytochrome SoxX [Tabrizicola sp. WMC-M-20]